MYGPLSLHETNGELVDTCVVRGCALDTYVWPAVFTWHYLIYNQLHGLVSRQHPVAV